MQIYSFVLSKAHYSITVFTFLESLLIVKLMFKRTLQIIILSTTISIFQKFSTKIQNVLRVLKFDKILIYQFKFIQIVSNFIVNFLLF